MKITDRIGMEVKRDNDLKALEEMMQIAIKSAKRSCEEHPCDHDILVKFYGDIYSPETIKLHGEKKQVTEDPYAYYMCLGCKKMINNYEATNKKNIIDLTNTKKIDYYDKSALVMLSYLQVLVKQITDENPNFTDKDITDMLNKDVDVIKVPDDFNQDDELRKCYLH